MVLAVGETGAGPLAAGAGEAIGVATRAAGNACAGIPSTVFVAGAATRAAAVAEAAPPLASTGPPAPRIVVPPIIGGRPSGPRELGIGGGGAGVVGGLVL